MLRVALKMLMGDRAKYLGLLFGITFTSFLVTFAASYFCGFMTRGFALIAENGEADVWIMDPAVASVEQTTNMVASALDRVAACLCILIGRMRSIVAVTINVQLKPPRPPAGLSTHPRGLQSTFADAD
jgi:hypothetical protein